MQIVFAGTPDVYLDDRPPSAGAADTIRLHNRAEEGAGSCDSGRVVTCNAAITATQSDDFDQPVPSPDTPSEQKDMVIDSLRKVAATDEAYLALIAAVESGFSTRREPELPPA
ncbi:hypothetical protein OUZ56_026542 [Daphnia magna]|uniref:Uncharacterized protein n=1 Tax=Daphnia magna TaxID=35525 RepID=A0ABQ9ZM27_9CRUS|nr:hypothetical protein OUZ56_026542 [Daphnia magna]